MSTRITDERFLEAWNDLDNARMMRSVARPYRDFVDDDECVQLMRMGLLKALDSHDPTSRRKFISSLMVRTRWVFQTHARTHFRKQRLRESVLRDPPRAVQSDGGEREADLRDAVEALLGQLDPDERRVVSHYYLDDMNLTEIGRRTGLSRTRVARLHQSGMTKLRYCIENKGEYRGDRTRTSY